MEPPSVPLYRGLIPWQGLLLTASLLTSWNPPTTAQLTVQSMPPSAAEGTDVLLHVHNLTESPLGYYWDKGDRVASTNRILSYVVATEAITPGPTYSNRETIYPNGSLLLQNVTQNDTGYYTIQVLSQTLQSEEATGQLRVYPKLPKPSIASTNSNPVEDKDSVSLTCEPETPDTTYLWWINGQSLRISDRLVMSRDNRTLTLQNITRNDIGPYECGNWNPVSSNRSDPFTLNVLYGPNAPTISPPESYYRPGANLTLSCHADSNPPAQYSWLINERPQQATRELFIASVTVNNSGSYACVAQNSATGCNGTTVKNITVSEELPRPFITSNNSNPVENKDSVALTCEPAAQDVTYLWWLNNQSLPVSPRLQLSPDNRTLTLFDVTRDDSGPFVCEIQTPESSNHSDPFTLNVLYAPVKESPPGLSAGAIVGIVIGVLAGVALIAALAYFLSSTSRRASDQHDLTEHKSSASNHSEDHSDNSPDNIDEIAYSSLNFKAQKPTEPTSASPPPMATETIYSEVKKK
ncbi:carcinoembryonic antigen-related cell adhesion molecule 6-like isoform X4 [Nycticebus coucang]|uniref:carcinoembryonic antigen-related cell adhesion molecule 6-like isoform X4 n=1 Tax=Nycticebus coucang TaxID=9470 RepID=UPI00234C674C|nr:carcinoembryonic antigen-related cell adhesion molecule 6-like isoform X4 [Nycticebus coucang]